MKEEGTDEDSPGQSPFKMPWRRRILSPKLTSLPLLVCPNPQPTSYCRLELTICVAADISAQAMISLHLAEHFPKDPIIGEEDTSELKANDPLRERVVKLVNEYHGKQSDFSEDR